MWIVKVALNRPYTFIILALLILLLSPVIILRTPVDIFPNINIPVVAISWTYTGLNPEEFEGQITLPYEKVLTTLVDNIQHIESATHNGVDVVKVYLQPRGKLRHCERPEHAASQFYSQAAAAGGPAAADHQLQRVECAHPAARYIGRGAERAAVERLQCLNFIRPQLITVPGAVIPSPYGGKQRQIMVNIDQ